MSAAKSFVQPQKGIVSLRPTCRSVLAELLCLAGPAMSGHPGANLMYVKFPDANVSNHRCNADRQTLSV
jgi:hypothetical protein